MLDPVKRCRRLATETCWLARQLGKSFEEAQADLERELLSILARRDGEPWNAAFSALSQCWEERRFCN